MRRRKNPLSDLSTAQTVGIVAASAAALGIVGYFIWKSQQTATAPGAALWDAFNSPGTVPPGVIQLTPTQTAANPTINPVTNLPWGETPSQANAAYITAHPGAYVNANGTLVDPTTPQPGG